MRIKFQDSSAGKITHILLGLTLIEREFNVNILEFLSGLHFRVATVSKRCRSRRDRRVLLFKRNTLHIYCANFIHFFSAPEPTQRCALSSPPMTNGIRTIITTFLPLSHKSCENERCPDKLRSCGRLRFEYLNEKNKRLTQHRCIFNRIPKRWSRVRALMRESCRKARSARRTPDVRIKGGFGHSRSTNENRPFESSNRT